MLFTVTTALLVFVMLYFFMPGLLPVLKNGDAAQIERYIRSSGTAGGLVCIFILQTLQIWSVVISGIPIQLAAGAVYGPGPGIAVCLAASVLGLTSMFAVWCKLGKKLEELFPVNEKQSRLIEKFARSTTSPFITVVIACLVPLLPNGLIPLLASKIHVDIKTYAAAVTLGIFVNVVVCVFIGDQLAEGDALTGILLAAFLAALSALLYFGQDRLMQLGKRISH